MLVRAAKTLRTHWKKSIFFSLVGLYGVQYCKDLYRDSLLRVKYCELAKEYGVKPLYPGQNAKRVTVFLNPAAQSGKARKSFEKNAAPLLFLAGFEVTTVKTEYQGQAKLCMDVLEDTDAIVIAGGNGLVGEVVTGLLRRPDQRKVSKIPIGIIPVGNTNTFAHSLLKKGESNVEWMGELAMSIVRGTTKPVDVMHLKGENGKDVYALTSLTWSAFKDAEDRKSKYWFLGPLKHRFTYLMATAWGQWPPNKNGGFSYGDKCSGCSRCYVPDPISANAQAKWSSIIPPKAPPAYSTRDNPNCRPLYEKPLNAIEFQATTNNHINNNQENGFQITFGPDTISKTDFMKEGWKRVPDQEGNNNVVTDVITAPHFKLNPDVKEGSNVMFSIDNEQYDALPVDVTLLKNKLNIFCPLLSVS